MIYASGPYAIYNATMNTDLTVRVTGTGNRIVCAGSIALLRHGGAPESPIPLDHDALRAGHTFHIGPDVRLVSLEVRVTFTGPSEESAQVSALLEPAGRPEEPYCCELRGRNGSSRTCSIGVLV